MENIGIMLGCGPETDYESRFRDARELGMESCQLSMWNPELFTDETAGKINLAMQKTGLSVSLLWAGWTGPCEWNFTAGPDTIGLVPSAYRAMRLDQLKLASGFAQKIGVTDIATHVGFIPENPSDPEYNGLVAGLRDLCRLLQSRGQYFLFETGQETPVTMLRTIEQIGMDNIGINFDTGNLILYGKANPVDAMRVFGRYVRNTHIKDGFYPENGRSLGREVKVGEGLANMPEILRMLKDVGYHGAYTIEREISGEQQKKDIAETVDYLRGIFAQLA